MLPEINGLPRAEREPRIGHGDHLARPQERGTEMRRHVVRAFVIVLVAGRLGAQTREPPRKVALYRRVRVLLDQERRARVLHEDGAEPRPNARAPDNARHVTCDVPRTRCRPDPEHFLMNLTHATCT